MKRRAAFALLSGLAASSGASTTSDGWTLVWADEFSAPAIDKARWTLEDDCYGGGNNERQCYTRSPRNAVVEDGRLIITARYERTSGPSFPAAMRRKVAMGDREVVRDFSSARLSTKGKASWRYGRIEVRAKLPQGQGTWPAIWMLPEKSRYGPWAASGEIDILEAVNLGVICAKCKGGIENTILGTIHFGGKWPGNKLASTEFSYPEVLDGFHTYAFEWYPDRIVWQVDGQTFATRNRSEWMTSGSKAPGAPFDQPFHLILNLAIGGKLPEERGLGGVRQDGYPKRMEIDWVRVWQKPGAGASDPAGAAQARGI